MIKDYTSFIDFIKTGRLGPLDFQVSKTSLIDILGRPKSIYDSYRGEKDKPEILTYHYKNLEIIFYDSEPLYISVGFDSRKAGLPKELQISWHKSAKKLFLGDFVNILKTENITCERLHQPALIGENAVLWLPQGRIDVRFLIETDLRIWNITAVSKNISHGRWETSECF
ncbi:MAG: hypothetical protein OEZ02_12355 [Anaerolineae bacterium]|nr:hypothetical protein [Anaerolineae bacterium]